MPFRGTPDANRNKKDKTLKDVKGQEEKMEELPANRYATSIHVLVSASLKLLRTGRIPRSRKTYRGLGTTKLGTEWFEDDERGARCGVELGFMSTTTSRQVALDYSGVKAAQGVGAVFEFDVGATTSTPRAA